MWSGRTTRTVYCSKIDDLFPLEGRAPDPGNGPKIVHHFEDGQDVFLCTSKVRPLSAIFRA